MKRNTKKTLLIGSTSLLAVVLGVAVVNHTEGFLAYRTKAQGEIVNGTITFSCNASTYHKIADTKYTFAGTTSRGSTIYLYSENNYNISSSNGLVASFGSGSYSSKFLTFTSDAGGSIQYNFQNVQSMTITTKSTSGSNSPFSIFTSTSGPAAYSGTIDKSSSLTISTEISGAKYLKLVPTSSSFLDIVSISIAYSCDPSATPEEPEEPEGLSGNYSYSSWVINFDNLTYTYGNYVMTFSYEVSGDGITFTYVSGDNSDFGNNKLFNGSETINSTGHIISASSITVTTYSVFGPNSRNFTK